MRVAILCIVLLASANAMTLMEKYPLNFSTKRSIMTLMAQVDEKIKAGGPYDAITRILDEFEQGIQDEQTKHNELHAENQASCAEEISFRQNAVREAEGAIKEATVTLEGCESQLNRAKADLRASENQLANTRQSLGILERERIEQHEIFQKDQIAYDALINGIAEALQIVEELRSGSASFVQMTKHTNKLMLSAAQTRSVAGLTSIMSTLVQVQSAGNADAMWSDLTGRFEQFREETIAKKQASLDLEAEQVAHYNTVKARLTATIQKLTVQIENLQAEIAELKKCITIQAGLLSSAQAKLTRNAALLKSANNLCQRDIESYEQQTAARRDELELLVAIKHKVHERYAQIDNEHGTIDRASMSGEEIQNSYENASAYDHQTFQG